MQCIGDHVSLYPPEVMLGWVYGAMGALLVPVIVGILNKMPARCFCDYDEQPGEIHNPPRATMKKQGWICCLFMAAVSVLLYRRFGAGIQSTALMLFCAALTMISLSDLRFTIIPDELLIAGGMLAILSAIPGAIAQNSLIGWLSLVLGAVIGAGFILILNLLGRLFYKRDALGMGDLKLFAVCGLACGPMGVVYVAILTLFVAGGFFAIAMALKKMNADDYRPLGPYIVLAAVLTLCFQPVLDAVVNWYLSFL